MPKRGDSDFFGEFLYLVIKKKWVKKKKLPEIFETFPKQSLIDYEYIEVRSIYCGIFKHLYLKRVSGFKINFKF